MPSGVLYWQSGTEHGCCAGGGIVIHGELDLLDITSQEEHRQESIFLEARDRVNDSFGTYDTNVSEIYHNDYYYN